MGSILSRKKFKRGEYRFGDAVVTYRLRRPEFLEQGDVTELVMASLALSASGSREDLEKDPAQAQALIRSLYSALRPEALTEIFKKFVDKVEGLEIEGDDEVMRPATTGEELLSAATEPMVVHVLMELFQMTRLSHEQGKASESPSTSSPVEATPNAGGSVATSTGVEVGPQP